LQNGASVFEIIRNAMDCEFYIVRTTRNSALPLSILA
jgi:hypothetical protein